MSHMCKYQLVFLIGLALVGCKENGSWEPKGEFQALGVEKTSKEYLIPRDLREYIEQEYLKYIHKENPKIVLADAEILNRIPREFLDVSVFLQAPAPGVLTDNVRFELPRGGGEIDLANVVKGKKGSFFMHFSVQRNQAPSAPLKNLRVYYMSEAKSQVIAGETFGSGCHRYMDVSNTLLKANAGKGLQLNATDLRYLPVIGGVLYFVDFDPERKIFIAAVRFTDSRYPDYMCAELK